jgi:hypothetical protein
VAQKITFARDGHAYQHLLNITRYEERHITLPAAHRLVDKRGKRTSSGYARATDSHIPFRSCPCGLKERITDSLANASRSFHRVRQPVMRALRMTEPLPYPPRADHAPSTSGCRMQTQHLCMAAPGMKRIDGYEATIEFPRAVNPTANRVGKDAQLDMSRQRTWSVAGVPSGKFLHCAQRLRRMASP